jgi:hypothetical protein
MQNALYQYILLEKTAVLRVDKVKAMQAFVAAFATGEYLSLSEIRVLMQAIEIRQPVFEKLIYPVLEQGVETRSIDAIKIMIELMQHVYTYQSRRKEWKYDLADLLQIGLLINPNDYDLLKWKYESAVRFLAFSIHEVPWCVLYGNNAASQSECQDLLEYTDEVEQLSKSLSKDDTAFLAECRYYYQSFASYLAAQAVYSSFEAYLNQHPR